ncbi:hypothetical protein EP331_09500 [bacterium]|nr:MAG: hypothetical protein EP331_09500 [bacterium]
MKSKLFKLLTLALFFSGSVVAQQKYTLVTYNVENLFDADGKAIYEDYNLTDKDGNSLYSPRDVFNKTTNVVRVLKQYNGGAGPDIIAFTELESDFTPSHRNADPQAFLNKYAGTTLDAMLGKDFSDEIADLPSEFLMLKAMSDMGLTGYNTYFGYSDLVNGEPETVQKNAVFTKFPIDVKKSKLHKIKEARPIVEAWLSIEGQPFVVFVNHWKSGASRVDMEAIRVQNAEVLRERLDALHKEAPSVDYVLAGDFNTEYNQHYYLKKAPKIAIREVLGVGGNEKEVASNKKPEALYNLWYELAWDKRGSEAYRGNLGTLMNLIISGNMYDGKGIQYVDNSFKVGSFPGLNTFAFAPVPKRWNSYGDGSGFSDHLPVSMEIQVAKKPIDLKNPGVENDENDSKEVNVVFQVPSQDDVFHLSEVKAEDLKEVKYFNEYFYCELTLNDKDEVMIGDTKYKVYSETKDIREVVKQAKEKNNGLVKFFGRHTLYKTTWEFIIESPDYVLNAK